MPNATNAWPTRLRRRSSQAVASYSDLAKSSSRSGRGRSFSSFTPLLLAWCPRKSREIRSPVPARLSDRKIVSGSCRADPPNCQSEQRNRGPGSRFAGIPRSDDRSASIRNFRCRRGAADPICFAEGLPRRNYDPPRRPPFPRLASRVKERIMSCYAELRSAGRSPKR